MPCAASPAGASASLSGLTTTAKAVYSVLLWQAAGRPLIIVVDGNKQAEALSEAVQTFFNLLAAEDRNGPQLLPALDVAAAAEPLAARRDLRAARHRACGGWPRRRVPITILPVASALLRIEPGDFYRQLALKLQGGRRSAARRSGRAPGEHRLRAARAGGDGGRILGARRHPGRLLAGSRQAGAHRPVRRPGGIHPPVRRGIAAVGAEDRGLHAAAAHGISEIARSCWWNWAS